MRAAALARAALWAFRSVGCVRRGLALDPTGARVSLPPVPSGAQAGGRGVSAALRLQGANCLVRATVRQAWLAAHGDRRDVVIGVTLPSAGFEAHAWLEGDPPTHSARFSELSRRPARP